MGFFTVTKKESDTAAAVEQQPQQQQQQHQQQLDPETPYYNSSAADGGDTAPPQDSATTTVRQGNIFLNLCDMRVATVLMNSLYLFIVLIWWLVSFIRNAGSFLPILHAVIPPILLSSIAIWGAMHFELWAVVMASIGFAVGFMIDLVGLNIFGIVLGLLVLIPTATLAHQLHTGVMTKQNYREQEEFFNYDVVEEKMGIPRDQVYTFQKNVTTKLGQPDLL